MTGPRSLVARSYLNSYRLWVALCIAAGIILRSGVHEGSLLGDDWDHYAMYAGIYPVDRAPLDYYDFVADSRSERAALLGSGRFPWWTSTNIHLGVLRPLSSALIWLDFAILGVQQHPERLHLQSLVWWSLLIAGAAALLHLVLPTPVAAIAVLLYALDDSHTLPFGWNANRSEIVAIALVFWASWAHVLARTRERPRLRALSIGLFALALLAGEHAVGPLAYVAMFEATRISERPSSRIISLLPAAALTLGYLAIRHGLGYGLAGSSFYIDPVAQPLRFLAAAVERIPILLGDLSFGFASEWRYWPPPWRGPLLELDWLPAGWLALDQLSTLQGLLGWTALAAIGVVAIWLGRTRALAGRESLVWLLLGATASLLPVCGTLPIGRLAVAAELGFAAGWAFVLWRIWEAWRTGIGRLQRVGSVLVFAAVVSVHVVYAAQRSRDETNYWALLSRSEEAWVLGADLPAASLSGRHVFVVRAMDWLSQFALPFAWHMHGRGMPASCETLVPQSSGVAVLERVSSDVIDLELAAAPERFWFGRSVYRLEDAAFHTGERIASERFEVQILAQSAGEPTHLRFVFPSSLDDPRYVFLYPVESGLRRLVIPAIGQQLKLPAPARPRSVAWSE